MVDSPEQTISRLCSTLKASKKVEECRAAINTLYDLLVSGSTSKTKLSIELLEALLRVIADFNKEDVGLLTSALAILGNILSTNNDGTVTPPGLGHASTSILIEEEVQDAFIRAGGIESMVEVLTARHLLASTGNRGTAIKVLMVMLTCSHAHLIAPRYIIVIPGLVEVLASASEVLVTQALRLLISLFSSGPGLGELQKVAVYAGALEHCLAGIRELAVYEEVWLLLKLLLHKNQATVATFMDMEGPRKALKQCLPAHDTPVTRALLLQIATECCRGIGRHQQQEGQGSLSKQFFDQGYLNLAIDSLDKWEGEVRKEALELIEAMARNSPIVQEAVTSEQVNRLLFLAVDLGDPLAALTYEALCIGNPRKTTVPRPPADLLRPMSFRLLAVAEVEQSVGLDVLLTALRQQSNLESLVAVLYYFVMQDHDRSPTTQTTATILGGILTDSILVQLILDLIVQDDGPAGGLAACLLLNQLASNMDPNSPLAIQTRAMLSDHVPDDDLLLARLDRISHESQLCNRQLLAPLVEKARRVLRTDPEIQRLRQEIVQLSNQLGDARSRISQLETENARLLQVLSSYDTELAQLRALLQFSRSAQQLDSDEQQQQLSQGVTVVAQPTIPLARSMIQSDTKPAVDELVNVVPTTLCNFPPPPPLSPQAPPMQSLPQSQQPSYPLTTMPSLFPKPFTANTRPKPSFQQEYSSFLPASRLLSDEEDTAANASSSGMEELERFIQQLDLGHNGKEGEVKDNNSSSQKDAIPGLIPSPSGVMTAPPSNSTLFAKEEETNSNYVLKQEDHVYQDHQPQSVFFV